MNNIIIACDFSDKHKLETFLNKFDTKEITLKIGMELFYKEGPSLVRALKKAGYSIFLDLKLHDIPNTVEKAMMNIGCLGVDMVNVHASGGIEMMKSAKRGLKRVQAKTKLIAVTQLTSTDQTILEEELGIHQPMNDIIMKYALNAKEAGLDGVVCSPLEAPLIHEHCGKSFLTITPGIRFAEGDTHDQKRIATPQYAKELKTDYIVVGRSITESTDPCKTYQTIKELFNE